MLYVQSIKNKNKLIRHWSSLEIDMQEMKWKQCVWAIGHDCRLKLIVVETQAQTLPDICTVTVPHNCCYVCTTGCRKLLSKVHKMLHSWRGCWKWTIVPDSCWWQCKFAIVMLLIAVVDIHNTSRQLLLIVHRHSTHALSMLTAVVDSAQYLCCWQVMMTVHNIYVADCALGWSDLAFF